VTDLSVRPHSRVVDERRCRARSLNSSATRTTPSATATLTDRAITQASAWIRSYRRLALASDVVVILAANVLGLYLRFGIFSSPVEFAHETKLSYRFAAFFVVAGWLIATYAVGSYDVRYLGTGSEEFKRVVQASVLVAAGIGLVCYLAQANLSRGYVATTLAIGTAGLVCSRYLLRKYVHGLRSTDGGWSHRVLAVGTREAVCELITQTRAAPYAGYNVVGACLPAREPDLVFGASAVPVVGSLADVDEAIRAVGADSVAVTRAPEIGSAWLTRLAWRLEGSGVALAVAPALTNVAGPRISIRPVAGLPLLHVEEPELSGRARLIKTLFERALAVVALVLFAPFIAAIALAIRIDSPGPVLFRQERVGQDGRSFRLFKFRSMVSDAEIVTMHVAHLNEADSAGFLFKIRQDPRVTGVGRWIRRYSLDEIPQLFNVLRGEMALVGPRPPLPQEVERYGPDLRRRLVVKPGITGLWQVSGRSDLSWDDAVRLDLFYVENWSMALDLQILWKTIFAVVRARGAY
jgi:exopolysaccharide biosynthesis polyprenyl glycosylphosphotransferase